MTDKLMSDFRVRELAYEVKALRATVQRICREIQLDKNGEDRELSGTGFDLVVAELADASFALDEASTLLTKQID